MHPWLWRVSLAHSEWRRQSRAPVLIEESSGAHGNGHQVLARPTRPVTVARWRGLSRCVNTRPSDVLPVLEQPSGDPIPVS